MEIRDIPNRNRIGSNFWVNSENKTFEELTNANEILFQEWAYSRTVANNPKYANKMLKPINGYAMNFCPKPDITTGAGTLTLRYKTHAEIWFEQRDDGIYALDKTWQRQFYPSHLKVNGNKDCFNAAYKFYIPWLLDIDAKFQLESVNGSPIKIINSSVNFKRLEDKNIWNCDWFHFFIKSSGDHVKTYNNKVYGILDVGTPICDIIIKDEKIIEELLRQHEE